MSTISSKSSREDCDRESAAHEREQFIFLPIFRGARGDDLLRQNVQRSFGNLDAVEFARDGWRGPARRIRAVRRAWWRRSGLLEWRRASDRRGQRAASATAMERGEPIWQTRSTVPISMPSSSEAVATSARISPAFSFRFDRQAPVARKAAVMRGHRVLAKQSREMMRNALGKPACVDEN